MKASKTFKLLSQNDVQFTPKHEEEKKLIRRSKNDLYLCIARAFRDMKRRWKFAGKHIHTLYMFMCCHKFFFVSDGNEGKSSYHHYSRALFSCISTFFCPQFTQTIAVKVRKKEISFS